MDKETGIVMGFVIYCCKSYDRLYFSKDIPVYLHAQLCYLNRIWINIVQRQFYYEMAMDQG